MENLKTTSVMDNITYESKCANGFGSMIIKGLSFPPNPDFDPLGKIWASVRKRIEERWKVSVTGIFFYEQDMSLCSCNFCLNFAPVERLEISDAEYRDRFEQTFNLQMALFEEVINCFVTNENGYNLYLKCLEAAKDITDDEERYDWFNMMFNDFLKKINIKTEQDEENKAKRREAIQKALSNLKSPE